MDNWSSIFLDGASERSVSGDETAYRFSGTVISRNSEEVTLLTKAEISNAKNADAFWSVNASKLWLLPGSDFAISNFVLKVGNIPVLWFPFFFYPSDEIIFHPVLGFRTREGSFFQTTTYILGRPKTSGTSESSITKIFSTSGDMEKERQGVFLRTTGKKSQDPNSTRLSVLFDAYANLGAYLGTELALPRKGALGALDFSFGVGFTRNIYEMGTSYTPFPNYDGSSEWNSSLVLSNEVPLRYRLETNSSLSGQYGTLSWSFPIYSDSYMKRDFMNRTEGKDLISMIRDMASDESTETTNVDISSYDWRLNGNFTPPVKQLTPYITALSFSSISSSLNFSSRASPKYSGPSAIPNPGRMFFIPNKFNILSLSASMSGTPFSLGGGTSTASVRNDESAPGDSLLPALPLSPWESKEPGESGVQNAASQADLYSLTPPALAQRFSTSNNGARLSFDYRISPSFGSELQFRTSSSNWKEAEDVDWSEIKDILSRVSADANMGLALTHPAYTTSVRLSGNGGWQDYTYLNKEAEEYTTSGQPNPDLVVTAKDRAYSQTFITSYWDFSTAIKPFYRSSVWGNSSLNYNARGLFAKTKYDNALVTKFKEDDPRWEWVFGAWKKEDLQTHSAGVSLAANIMDYNQNLTVTATLPPLDALLSGSATARAWISETTAQTSILEPFDEGKREFRPISVTETLRFNTLINFQQYIVYDPELGEYKNMNSTLNLGSFRAVFRAAYMVPYVLNHNGIYGSTLPTGWIPKPVQFGGEQELSPQDLTFSYSKTLKKEKLLNKKLSFSCNLTSWMTFDLQRYTYSSLNLSLGLTASINNFLDLSLQATSANSQIYRYFQNLPFFTTNVIIPSEYETNFFIDLLNSFRIDNIELRKKSGFKLKTLSLNLIHHLGDWNAKLGLDFTPYQDTTGPVPVWKFNNQISFLVQWVPIAEIKTEFIYEKDKLTFK
jgi:hypothetical protein